MCRLRILGRIAARKGVEAGWAQGSSDQLGGMADHMVLVALEVAAELQAVLFCPDALTASLGELLAVQQIVPRAEVAVWRICLATSRCHCMAGQVVRLQCYPLLHVQLLEHEHAHGQ